MGDAPHNQPCARVDRCNISLPLIHMEMEQQKKTSRFLQHKITLLNLRFAAVVEKLKIAVGNIVFAKSYSKSLVQ